MTTLEMKIHNKLFRAGNRQMVQHRVIVEILQGKIVQFCKWFCVELILSFQCLRYSNLSSYGFIIKPLDYTLLGAVQESAVEFGLKMNQMSRSPIAGTRLPIGVLENIDRFFLAYVETKLRKNPST